MRENALIGVIVGFGTHIGPPIWQGYTFYLFLGTLLTS